MKRKTKVILIILAVVIPILIIAALLPALSMAEESRKLISCTNHRNHLANIMCWHSPVKSKKGDGLLPYDKDLPGYAVIAKIVNTGPGYNCNHGAPLARCSGGWQYINLPQSTLLKLYSAWEEKYPEKDMPVLWCGKNTGKDTRVGIHCLKQGNDIVVYRGARHVNKEDVANLNECLQKIGEKPVPLDIPDGIDWSKYKKEIENKKDVFNPPSSGK
jgi:hypothetical protein